MPKKGASTLTNTPQAELNRPDIALYQRYTLLGTKAHAHRPWASSSAGDVPLFLCPPPTALVGPPIQQNAQYHTSSQPSPHLHTIKAALSIGLRRYDTTGTLMMAGHGPPPGASLAGMRACADL
jgi:hypothetical protein